MKPSVDTEYYYTGIVGKSAYEAFADDEAFMKDVVEPGRRADYDELLHGRE